MRLLWLISSGNSARDAQAAMLKAVPGLSIDIARDPLESFHKLKCAPYTAGLAEFPASNWTAADWFAHARRLQPGLRAIICDFEGDWRQAVQLTKLGAHDYLVGNVPPEKILTVLEQRPGAGNALGPQPEGGVETAWEHMLVGESPVMRRLREMIEKAARRRSTVLITGETGTGKELVARALHLASARREHPFVAVNCAAVPEALLEAELFGHTKGAFTGAIAARIGRFEQAHRGNLFLDEIGDMPLEIQPKILRFLQEREVQRIGSSETVAVDVRIVAATNVELAERIAEERFREDLFYRLSVLPLHLPPLRERREDVPLLVRYFIGKVCEREGLPAREIHEQALEYLTGLDWPGNVRQLENAVERAIALSDDRETLGLEDFLTGTAGAPAGPAAARNQLRWETGLNFEQTLNTIELNILEEALARAGGNKTRAADMLGLKRTTLTAKLRVLRRLPEREDGCELDSLPGRAS